MDAITLSSALSIVYDRDEGGNMVAKLPECPVATPRGRLRRYPGLRSSAPDTLPFYRFAAKVLAPVGRGLDFGCGSGQGAKILSEACEHVVGYDPDPDALTFASFSSPRTAFEASLSADRFDVGVMVDVLGFTPTPFMTLRQLWKAVRPDGAILIAEPTADSGQQLAAPARRAFSRRALGSLLDAAGFTPERWVSRALGFNACVARRRDTTQEQSLEDALLHLDAGKLDRARHALASALTSDSAGVLAEATLLQAEIAIRLGDADLAASSFLATTRHAPQDPRGAAGMARLLYLVGDPSEARRLSTGALKLDPTDATAQALVAQLVESDAPHLSMSCWHAAANLEPSDPWLVTEFVRRMADASTAELVIQAIERLQAYREELDPGIHLALADVLQSVGRIADALVEARIASMHMPGDPAALELCERLQSATQDSPATFA